MGLIIFIHEFGHFIAGKIIGLKVKEFMFGLPGPRIFSFRVGETEYGATALPFGGYVKFAGVESELQLEEDDEDKDTPPERKYDTQPRWKKAIIMFAGPFMNMVLPIFLIAIMLMFQGVPDRTNVIGEVVKAGPAAKAGLHAGDKIITVEGKKVKNWAQAVTIIKKKPGKEITIVAERNGKTQIFRPVLDNNKGEGFLGISQRLRTPLPHEALYQGFLTTLTIIKFMAVTLYVVITQKIGLLAKDSAGPVRIVYESAKIIQQNFWSYIWLLALISINIGIVNLLPIPPLDGGRLAILGIEGIKRGPINKKAVFAINAAGMALLLALMVYFVFSDIFKIIQGAPFPGGG
ncbi:RIP metalloprotease RseP [Candidatus Aquicultor secundus]|uniref:RIP metalloprotease RseP n=1 Tax=Candidatus Aquicultor secundus TaxID=1973895 RepID=UPI00257E37E2|nr:RIP metalloprotease RseP [Candidatus Aquicultor secundus]